MLCFFCLCLTALILNLGFSRGIKREQSNRVVVQHVQHGVQDSYQMFCKEKTRIVFIKVHKTGGTTISNILQRFGTSRNLNFAIPNKNQGELRYNYFGGVGDILRKDGIAPLANNAEYDILCHHVIFNDLAFDEIFTGNITYITLLRDPVQQFLSALLYYNFNDKLYQVATKNITEYLTNPRKLEDDNPYLSFTNNRQSLDLGLNPNSLEDEELIDEYIYILDSRFDFVLITEYFDESLIMLKRQLCWELKDVLYMRKNPGYRTFDFHLTSDDMTLFKRWQLADYLIYRHFLKKFLIRMKQEKQLMEEVHHFQQILDKMNKFCDDTNSNHITIKRSPWNKEFTIMNLDCAFMRLSEISFLNKLHKDLRKLSK